MKREFERFAWYDQERKCVVLMSMSTGRSLQMVLIDGETVDSTYKFLERKLNMGFFIQELPTDATPSECSNCSGFVYKPTGGVWQHEELETIANSCVRPHPLSCRKEGCNSRACRGW